MSKFTLCAGLSLALIALTSAVPVRCRDTIAAVKEARTELKERDKTEVETLSGKGSVADTETAVLDRLAVKIDELRQLKLSSMRENAAQDTDIKMDNIPVLIPVKSSKLDVRKDIDKPKESDGNKVKNDEEFNDPEVVKENLKEAAEKEKKAKQESTGLSLRMATRLAKPSSDDGSFLTADERAGLSEYVRVKMLKGSRNTMSVPRKAVIRPTLPETLTRLAGPQGLSLPQKERDTLSKLIQGTGFQLKGDNGASDSVLGAFVRTALLVDEKMPEASAARSGGMSIEEAEKIALRL
jgi:hypothetical protein